MAGYQDVGKLYRASAPGSHESAVGGGDDGPLLENAAEALRKVELEAAQPNASAVTPAELDEMSIDELRILAKELDVPDRSQIIDRQELIAEIRRRL